MTDTSVIVVNWNGRDAFVGLGIGETEYWNKGYGTDVMNVLLRYAFMELNLLRVTLSVFEYNPRAIRSYEKAGFRHHYFYDDAQLGPAVAMVRPRS